MIINSKDVLKSENPDLYQKTVQNAKPNHEQMIKQLVPDTPHAELAREYLRGSGKVSDLYPYDEEFATGWAYGYGIPAEGRYLGLRVLGKDAEKNKYEILNYVQDGSKFVKNGLLAILYRQTDWEMDIEELLDAKKAAPRELAVHVLAHWQQEGKDYNKVLLQAMEKEKNAKVLSLLQGALNIQEGSSGNDAASQHGSSSLRIMKLHSRLSSWNARFTS